MKGVPSATFCDPDKSRDGHREKPWRHLQAVLWILLALFVIIYGNGKHDLITVARHHPAVWRYICPVASCVSIQHSILTAKEQQMHSTGRLTM